jgi:hypothetical protein
LALVSFGLGSSIAIGRLLRIDSEEVEENDAAAAEDDCESVGFANDDRGQLNADGIAGTEILGWANKFGDEMLAL